ncbi:hypothetical protein [Echinicola vietnamensis]|uniref:Uncharacterized protein n=1 Tax=Echinicola vietnamensis (strain DSM 17526 / LMG 23754 / KMM 6221) TaxID=926556 RepID=L0FYT5_ECHVK|nr:hypothetical protein [Echinicola vietnamensis]AGA78203.1 hypothetical protein Echvi_1949 [Echinicola vietnamensis DSM 17526]
MNALQQRKAGILPEIDIAGDTYTIDVRLGELRNKDQPWKRLGFDKMVTSEKGGHYLFFYRTRKQELFYASREMTTVPRDVVLVEIPHELHLDPVGMARKYELADDYFQKRYPIQAKLQASVVPLKKTGLLEHASRNRKSVPAHISKGQKP